MIQIPLSVSGDPTVFKGVLEAHRADLVAHRSGNAGVSVPVAHPLLESLMVRVHRGDPLPDSFEILPYEIVDDSPKTLEAEQALKVLRETLKVR